MAELTKLEAKRGEVTGLAMAAQAATKKVGTLAKKDKATVLVRDLNRMHADAKENRKALYRHRQHVPWQENGNPGRGADSKGQGRGDDGRYWDAESDALDGFEFLTMAEAGEVGHWSVLKTLNKNAGHADIASLVEWALPIQEGHLKGAMAGSVLLAGDEDPDELVSDGCLNTGNRWRCLRWRTRWRADRWLAGLLVSPARSDGESAANSRVTSAGRRRSRRPRMSSRSEQVGVHRPPRRGHRPQGFRAGTRPTAIRHGAIFGFRVQES